MNRLAATGSTSDAPTLALLPWGDLFEDWLDSLGVGLPEFRESFMGSWMFGWVEALQRAGVRTVIVAVTTRVEEPLRIEHGPTGATMYLLPPTTAYRRIAAHMAREGLHGRRDLRSLGAAALAQIAPYLATPPLALRKVLREEHCVAVVCQEYESPRFDVLVAIGLILRRPVYATFQGGDYQSSRLERYVRPQAMRRAAGLVIAPAAEARRVTARYGVPEARLARVFNPVDTTFWQAEDRHVARAALRIPLDATLVVWHGQFHPRKGLDVLVRAWARVRADRPGRDVRLLLVGAGDETGRELLERSASGAEGLELVEEWVVDRARIRRYLSAADIYAFPSRHEGLPVAPIEAAACGLPVVATDAQGVRDLFENGEADGGVVVERDDIDAFAQALGRLIDDEQHRLRLGSAARRRVEDAFALDAVGRELRAFLVDGTTIDL
ncbi:MAG: glycosyltransferase family 4 protein [Actinomycetota bacterium]